LGIITEEAAKGSRKFHQLTTKIITTNLWCLRKILLESSSKEERTLRDIKKMLGFINK
jgi:hypothetical protein